MWLPLALAIGSVALPSQPEAVDLNSAYRSARDLLKQGKEAKAMTSLQAFGRRHPASRDRIEVAKFVLLAEFDEPRALSLLRTQVRSPRPRAKALAEIGSMLADGRLPLRHPDYGLAADALRRARMQLPWRLESEAAYAQALYKAGRPGEAAKTLEGALQRSEGKADGREKLREALERQLASYRLTAAKKERGAGPKAGSR